MKTPELQQADSARDRLEQSDIDVDAPASETNADSYIAPISPTEALHVSTARDAPEPSSSTQQDLCQQSISEQTSTPIDEERVVISTPPSIEELRRQGIDFVGVFYATDREKYNENNKVVFMDSRSPNGKLNYGECLITIPSSYQAGKLEQPSWWQLEIHENLKKHLTLQTTTSLEEAEFLRRVTMRVQNSPQHDIFIFIHGSNVGFEDAARRTGQLAWDFNFRGAPVLYSWPASGKLLSYKSDEANVMWTDSHLERFLLLLSQQTSAKRIHILVHGMGSRAVCDSLRTIGHSLGKAALLKQLIFAAPDIDIDSFSRFMELSKRISARTTLYTSSADRENVASHKSQRHAAVGKPLLVIPGIETIETSSIETDLLAHSRFTEKSRLVSDIKDLIHTEKPAAKRPSLTEKFHTHAPYYVFSK